MTSSNETETKTPTTTTKVKSKTRDVSYFELYRYATLWDYVLIVIALIAAFLKSLVHPIAIVVYSELIGLFIERNLGIGTTSTTYTLPIFGGGKILTNASHMENMAELKNDAWSFGILITLDSLLMFVTGIVYVDLFNRVALRVVVRLRREYFKATIRQDIGWHDTAQQHNFALHITDNMEKLRNGIAENVGHFVQLIFDIVISIVISFAYGWKLTLAICCYIPITICINVVVAKFQSKLTAREQNSYGLAGTLAEEVFGAIRTVVAFGGERSESERFDRLLVPARKASQMKGACTGLSDSVLKAMLFISSAGAFWYGTHLILDDRYKEPENREYTPTIVMIVIAGIIVGADHIARTTPFLEAFATARGAAAAIYEVIETQTKIDPLAQDGKILNYGVCGRLEFQDIFFRYPARDDAIVLRGLNLSIAEGATVALVGHSGSGKSTCIQLLQRFYDPIFGRVLLDGEDIRKYNVSWLRSTMAVVGQESVLFQGTIGENIRHGKLNATQKEVEDAAKAANAHDFITMLPNSYETLISEKGIQLSGGQRQRIAIARALIQNPKILLLDEATSALDYHSEKLVQQALDYASKGRTTLVVSHRLSAIRHAERIVYLDNGRIVEDGTHEQLMLLGGKYYEMVMAHEYDGDAEQLFNEIEELEELEPARKYSDDLTDPSRGSKYYNHLTPRLSKTSVEKNALHVDAANVTSDGAASDEPNPKDISYIRTFLRILRSARPEWCFLTLATICAGIYGCSHPIFSIIFAEMYASFTEPDETKVLQRIGEYTIVCLVCGIGIGIVCFIQTYFFNLAGVWLTTRMRSTVFQTIMRQDMAWFDLPTNSVGALSARLAGDASGVQGAIGFPLSNIIQAITNFICCVSIAFYFSWELALICLCTSPFMVASIIFEAKFMTKSALEEKLVLEETSRIATEAITQIRTVAALRRENGLIHDYGLEVIRYEQQIKRKLRFRGLVNSLGMAIMFFGYAVTLTYGGIMNADGRIDFADIITISNTMLYGLFLLAQSLAFTPIFNAAIISANRLFQINDRQSVIQSPPCTLMMSEASESELSERTAGKMNVVQGVSLRNVHFSYPTRRQQPVLRGLNLEVLQGKTVALVGASGSGKSTCVQLLLRYYDPDAGNILIESYDIHRDLSLNALRQCLGIVSQEPSLFEKTIAENIAYGAVHRTVSMTEVMAAAKMANAHDFITALANGYETRLGAKGTQLSGGQKQRIAIARALVRNPKILLLDEATSALDLQSERVVQSALDKACTGRTCIVIAHRLATVQKADVICVLQHGHIVEQGNHPTLLAKNGLYAKLYHSQPKT